MKILQVLFSGLGGHGSVAFSLVRGDRARAHEHVLVFYGVEPLACGYAEACGQLGVTHDYVGKRPGPDLLSWGRLLAVLRRAAPDVLLMHSMNLVAVGAVHARLTGTPLIAVDHLSNQVKACKDWAFSALALVLANRTVFLTCDFAAEVQARMGRLYRPERVAVIGNGIDIETFAPSAPGRPGGWEAGVLTVGMHARFSPSKDHATLVRAAALVPTRGLPSTPPVRFVLAGDGETLATTRALARQLGVEDRVVFPGMLPESRLPAYLRSLDVYVQSSRGETMSTALMQAMATGLPVIASDVPGLRNMVRPGETGLLFPCGDAEALARILVQLRNNPTNRERLGRTARAQARASWSHETMFRQYEALLREAGRNRRHAGPAVPFF